MTTYAGPGGWTPKAGGAGGAHRCRRPSPKPWRSARGCQHSWVRQTTPCPAPLTYPDVEAGHHHLSRGRDDGDVLTNNSLFHVYHLAWRENAMDEWREQQQPLPSCGFHAPPPRLRTGPGAPRGIWWGFHETIPEQCLVPCSGWGGGCNVNVRPCSVKPSVPGTLVMEAWMPGPFFHSTPAPAVVWKFPLLPTTDTESLYSGTASLSFVPLPRICRGPSTRTPGLATAPGPA